MTWENLFIQFKYLKSQKPHKWIKKSWDKYIYVIIPVSIFFDPTYETLVIKNNYNLISSNKSVTS